MPAPAFDLIERTRQVGDDILFIWISHYALLNYYPSHSPHQRSIDARNLVKENYGSFPICNLVTRQPNEENRWVSVMQASYFWSSISRCVITEWPCTWQTYGIAKWIDAHENKCVNKKQQKTEKKARFLVSYITCSCLLIFMWHRLANLYNLITKKNTFPGALMEVSQSLYVWYVDVLVASEECLFVSSPYLSSSSLSSNWKCDSLAIWIWTYFNKYLNIHPMEIWPRTLMDFAKKSTVTVRRT